MRFRKYKMIIPLFSITVISFQLNCMAETRISFLSNTQALEETATLLLKNGCQKDSVAGFKAAVTDYYKAPNPYDALRFPIEREGFYYFIDVNDLLNRMDGSMGNGKSNGRLSIACMGAVTLVMNNMGLSATNTISNLYKEGEAEYPTTKANWITTLSSEQDCISKLTGVQVGTNDFQAAISLMASRRFPTPTSGQYNARELFILQRERWKADGLNWHSGIGIVAVHMYSIVPGEKRIRLSRDHVALCFRDNGRVILVEKTSRTGPFLRGDFNSEDELAEFLIGAVLKPSLGTKKKIDPYHYFVSIDDRLIRSYDPPEKQTQNKDGSNKALEAIGEP